MSDLFFSSSGNQSNSASGTDWLALANNLAGLTDTPDPVVREGRRLQALQILTARPGQPMSRVYGRMRVGGHVLWRGKLVEHIDERGGGGGKADTPATPLHRHFTYTMDLAIGLCEGPISHIGRVWADGKLVDMSTISFTLYRGTPTQMPDATIARHKGETHTSAFRGLAYIVLRGFNVSRFGNRVPQLSFEVFCPIGEAAAKTNAVCLLPGASEFAYHPTQQVRVLGISRAEAENIHASPALSDWHVSLDQLQESHPECRRVALVVAWFGTDLRVDKCKIEPRVDNREKNVWPAKWHVAGRGRRDAILVSQIDGRAAFGGTPSDDAVRAAIKDLHRRGLEVMFYPFIMMDIPPTNTLPDPYGGARQSVYPWRGRISCYPAPGHENSPDGTPRITKMVASFIGQLRAMIAHYAGLCAEVGGVEAFLIGSELRGISRLRDNDGHYPFADGLVELAGVVRALLPDTKISYAADWSEYGAHQPYEGALDFPLDAFWADDNCDFIGIDNYVPLADWRDGATHLDAQNATASPHDIAYLQSNIEGGEYYDWYYVDAAARAAQNRTPISDGLNKPFVFRAKDFRGWWSSPHIIRRRGNEALVSPWRVASKPIWFTELGCPAVDKGANQPNVFPDDRSDEGGLPHYSNGARDDRMQQAYLKAVTDFYTQPQNNPLSRHYGAAMVDTSHIYFWAWDARPFPAFPYRRDIWSDGANWHTGHWLNGRHASAPIAALLAALAADVPHRLDPMQGVADGFAIGGPVRALDALKPILRAFGIDALPDATHVRFAGRAARAVREIAADDILSHPPMRRRRQNGDKIKRFDLHFMDGEGDYGTTHVSARHAGGDAPVARLHLPLALATPMAEQIAERLLHEARLADETLTLSLPPRFLDLQTGDIIGFDGDFWRITRLAYDGRLSVTAQRHMAGFYETVTRNRPAPVLVEDNRLALPHVEILDLPRPALRHQGAQARALPLVTVAATPWPGQVDIRFGGQTLAMSVPSLMGQTRSLLPRGPIGRWDRGTVLEVEIFTGTLEGLPAADVLAGGNRLALKTAMGWEVMQFGSAELIGERRYRLSHLLRGQFGSDDAMQEALPIDTICVLLGEGVLPLATGDGESITLRFGIAGLPEDGYSWREASFPLRHAAQTCLSPVHGKVRMPRGISGPWRIAWTRRSREGGDDFTAPDIPLGEPQEIYRTEIYAGAELIEARQVRQAHFSLSARSRRKLLKAVQNDRDITVRVSQVNGQGMAGSPLVIALPSFHNDSLKGR